MSAKMSEEAGCGAWCRKHSPTTDVREKLMNRNNFSGAGKTASKKGHGCYSECSKKRKIWVLVKGYHLYLVSQPFFIITIKAS